MSRKTVKNKVIWLLQNYPKLRDDKKGCCVALWQKELEKYVSREELYSEHGDIMTATTFMEHLAEGHVSNPETILRWWRKAQQDMPELRGKEYNHRHNIEEPEVRETMRHDISEL